VTAAVYGLVAAGFAAAVAGTAARVWWYARHPTHLRWELYPVPHEAPDRARYGGSYFETPEWWQAPRLRNTRGEFLFMAREIAFLHALHASNRRLWYRSFPFHLGLYLVAACGFALLAAAALEATTGAPGSPGWDAIQRACAALGWAGVALTMVGAAALLVYRLTDRRMQAATTPGDLLNLALFVAAPGLLAAGAALAPAGAPDLLALTTGLLRWDTSLAVPGLLGAGLVACAALAAYIPMTHMSHYVGKWFTYHAVRWDDTPLADRRRVMAAIAAQLSWRPTWSADHMGADGKRSWADVASSNPAREP
jgi:nitrate reductase gamma subunit